MDILDKYLNTISQYPRITKKREKELSKIILKGKDPNLINKAKQELVNANLSLVVSCVFKLKNRFNINRDFIMDLISEGNITLMRVAETYDGAHKSKASFGTFAISAIDRKIMAAFNENKMIHIPCCYFSYKNKLKELENDMGKELTDDIILKKLSITQETLDMLRDESRGQRALFLEDVFEKDGISNWESSIGDLGAVDPSKESCSNSLKIHLDKHIGKLNKREQAILQARCLSDNPLSFDQIAESHSISRERVRQVYFAALRKLKNYMVIEWDKKHKDKITNKSRGYSCYGSTEDYQVSREDEEFEFNKGCKEIMNSFLNGIDESDKNEA